MLKIGKYFIHNAPMIEKRYKLRWNLWDTFKKNHLAESNFN